MVRTRARALDARVRAKQTLFSTFIALNHNCINILIICLKYAYRVVRRNVAALFPHTLKTATNSAVNPLDIVIYNFDTMSKSRLKGWNCYPRIANSLNLARNSNVYTFIRCNLLENCLTFVLSILTNNLKQSHIMENSSRYLECRFAALRRLDKETLLFLLPSSVRKNAQRDRLSKDDIVELVIKNVYLPF